MFCRSALPAVIVSLVVSANAMAQQPVGEKASPTAMAVVTAKSLTWTTPTIPGFVPGMALAVVSGDPSKEGPYIIRLRFPAGYVFPAHSHPKDEHLTVLSGTFLLGMGDKTNAAAIRTYGPGDFLLMPANMAHFGGAQGETVIQLHGTGPFDIKVLEQIAGAAK